MMAASSGQGEMHAEAVRGSATRGSAACRAGALVVALAACLALSFLLGSCGLPGGPDDTGTATDGARTLALARHEFAGAAEALRDRDRAGFLRWLPGDATAGSAAARGGLAQVYDTLSGLPWRTFTFSVTPLDQAAGVYRIVGSGQLGTAGPADRLAVVRYLALTDAADGAVVAGDRTPEGLRRRYLMALHDPVVLQRPGLIVLADRWARGRARTVLAAADHARPRLVTLGVDISPTVVITVYGSAEDERDALAVTAATPRLVYFSYPPLRVADKSWDVWDVGVMGPWLRDPGISTDAVLTHELAHAYTIRWLDGGERPRALLAEGIAEAAEGAFVTPALREEVATGDQLWPLPESFGSTDVWDGADGEAVSLGYDVGGSLVDYVVWRWGPAHLQRFVQAVAVAEPTEAGMDAALGKALGVDWRAVLLGLAPVRAARRLSLGRATLTSWLRSPEGPIRFSSSAPRCSPWPSSCSSWSARCCR